MATTKKRATKKRATKKAPAKAPLKAEELVAAPPTEVTITEPEADLVELAEEQRGVLKSLNDRVFQTKLEIANMTMQKAMLEGRINQTIQATAEMERSYQDRVSEIAKEHGIGSNPQSQWQFDVDTMVFRRVR